MDYSEALCRFLHIWVIFGIVGGSLIIRCISTPVMRKLEHKDPHSGVLLYEATRRLLNFFWVYLAICILTGIALTGDDPRFEGIGSIANTWSTVILIKHVLFFVFFAAISVQTLRVRKIFMLLKEGKKDEVAVLGRKMDFLALVYMFVGILILIVSTFTTVDAADRIEFDMVLLNSIHCCFNAFWIGGLMFLAFVGLPVLSRQINTGKMEVIDVAHHMIEIGNRFIWIIHVAILANIITGTIMMLKNQHYNGLFKLDSVWSYAMFAKHAIFFFMFVGGFYIASVIYKLNKMIKAVLKAREEKIQVSEEMKREKGAQIMALRFRMIIMARFGLTMGTICVLLTAIATAMK